MELRLILVVEKVDVGSIDRKSREYQHGTHEVLRLLQIADAFPSRELGFRIGLLCRGVVSELGDPDLLAWGVIVTPAGEIGYITQIPDRRILGIGSPPGGIRLSLRVAVDIEN